MKFVLFAFLALTVSCSGPQQSDPASSSLSGIYDDQYLLRLAETHAMPDEEKESRRYRFEICNASGKRCVGAFQNPKGEDVLIDIAMEDPLHLDRAEHAALLKQVDEYYDSQIQEHEEKKFVNMTIRVVGYATSLIGTGIFVGAFHVKNFFTSLKLAGVGAMILGSGGQVFFEANSRYFKADRQLTGAQNNKEDAKGGIESLPRYLHVKNGLLSTDPDNHVSVEADNEADVKKIAFALAKHLNAGFQQDQDPSVRIVDSVCSVKNDVKVCTRVSS